LQLWERRYLHPLYREHMPGPGLEGAPIPQLCPDVYDFPFLSERFCAELIQLMEADGKWSDGSHAVGSFFCVFLNFFFFKN
jgi:hypothetical protein